MIFFYTIIICVCVELIQSYYTRCVKAEFKPDLTRSGVKLNFGLDQTSLQNHSIIFKLRQL